MSLQDDLLKALKDILRASYGSPEMAQARQDAREVIARAEAEPEIRAFILLITPQVMRSRIRTVLREHNVNSLEDLRARMEDLPHMQHIGRRAVTAIQEALRQYDAKQ